LRLLVNRILKIWRDSLTPPIQRVTMSAIYAF
jgi:hypothetical protein